MIRSERVCKLNFEFFIFFRLFVTYLPIDLMQDAFYTWLQKDSFHFGTEKYQKKALKPLSNIIGIDCLSNLNFSHT